MLKNAIKISEALPYVRFPKRLYFIVIGNMKATASCQFGFSLRSRTTSRVRNSFAWIQEHGNAEIETRHASESHCTRLHCEILLTSYHSAIDKGLHERIEPIQHAQSSQPTTQPQHRFCITLLSNYRSFLFFKHKHLSLFFFLFISLMHSSSLLDHRPLFPTLA